MSNRTRQRPHVSAPQGAPFPDFTRINYFHGLMLGANDLRAEQTYHREKAKIHNRCLHGFGVVCGLLLKRYPPVDECEPASNDELVRLSEELDKVQAKIESLAAEAPTDDEGQKEYEEAVIALTVKRDEIARQMSVVAGEGGDHRNGRFGPKVEISEGLGVDCLGNDLVLNGPLLIDLLAYLNDSQRRRLEAAGDQGETLYLSICHCEEYTEPARPVVTHVCTTPHDCAYGKIRESVQIEVSLDPPHVGDGCDPCCCASDECCCLLLAALRDVMLLDGKLTVGHVDNGVRRMLTQHESATVTGVGWEHGASYDQNEMRQLLRKGLRVKLSRSVHTATLLAKGNVRLDVCLGGGGLAGVTNCVVGHATVDDPDALMTDEFWFRQTSKEIFDPGDRIQLTLRGDFILDECCTPMDGNNIGGLVPPLPDAPKPMPDQPRPYREIFAICPTPPAHDGAWTSGNGSGGGNFESWIFIGPGVDEYEGDTAA